MTYLVLRRLAVRAGGRARHRACSTRSCRTTSCAGRCICSWRRTTSSRSARTWRSRCSTVGLGSGWRRRAGGARGARVGLVLLLGVHGPARRRRGASLRFFASRDRRAFLPAGVRRGGDPGRLARPARADDRLPGDERDERRGREALLVRERELQPQAHASAPAGGRPSHRRAGLPARPSTRQQIPQNEGRAATLGIVASVGFLWLLGVALLAVVGAWPGVIARFRGLAALTLASVLVGDDRRPCDAAGRRVAADPGLEPAVDLHRVLRARWRSGSCSSRCGSRFPALGFGALLAGLLVLGALDQTSPFFIPPHAGAGRRLPRRPIVVSLGGGAAAEGASVVQLPHEPFPEPPLGPPSALRAGEGVSPHVGCSAGAGARCAAALTTGPRCTRRGPPRSSSRQRGRRASRRSWSTSSRTRTGAPRRRPTSAECSAQNRERGPEGRYLLWRL